MRRIARACAIPAALLLGGCDAVKSASDRYNPLVSFESRCERLPPGQIEIRQAASPVEVNDQMSLGQLSRLAQDNPATHRTLGLTRTELRRDVVIELTGLKDASGGRSCQRPQLTIELSMVPMTVYLASELQDNACGRAAVLDHELKHAAAFRDHLQETARRLGTELPAVFGQRIIVARDPAAGESQVRRELQAFMDEFDAANALELKARQAAVDSPDEYARVSGACGGIRVD
ncbi:MAG TPA: hypothetical protein PLW68_03850 [Casimicrobiaceae bacterium]|nr:hypothetical protein [Casimicrobiaceae bacterium]